MALICLGHLKYSEEVNHVTAASESQTLLQTQPVNRKPFIPNPKIQAAPRQSMRCSIMCGILVCCFRQMFVVLWMLGAVFKLGGCWHVLIFWRLPNRIRSGAPVNQRSDAKHRPLPVEWPRRGSQLLGRGVRAAVIRRDPKRSHGSVGCHMSHFCAELPSLDGLP